jgi:hypothetical protein
MYKTLKCDKNKMPYYNVQGSKKWNFWEVLGIVKHGPYWKKIINLSFIILKNYTLGAYIKFGGNLYHLTWKRKGQTRIGLKFCEEKGKFGKPLFVFQMGYPNHALT